MIVQQGPRSGAGVTSLMSVSGFDMPRVCLPCVGIAALLWGGASKYMFKSKKPLKWAAIGALSSVLLQMVIRK